jgi:hypothetical protein
MNILTHTKQIKVHTIQIDDSEIERFMDDHEEWIDLLSTLLIAKPAVDGNGSAPSTKKRKAAKKNSGTMTCPKCGMEVKPRGLLIHQRGSKCRARTAPTATIE